MFLTMETVVHSHVMMALGYAAVPKENVGLDKEEHNGMVMRQHMHVLEVLDTFSKSVLRVIYIHVLLVSLFVGDKWIYICNISHRDSDL